MLSLTAPDRPKVCLRAQAAARGQQRARLAASAGRSCFGRRRSAWANGAAGGLGGAAERTWAAGPPPSWSPTSPRAGAALPSAALLSKRHGYGGLDCIFCHCQPKQHRGALLPRASVRRLLGYCALTATPEAGPSHARRRRPRPPGAVRAGGRVLAPPRAAQARPLPGTRDDPERTGAEARGAGGGRAGRRERCAQGRGRQRGRRHHGAGRPPARHRRRRGRGRRARRIPDPRHDHLPAEVPATRGAGVLPRADGHDEEDQGGR